MDNDNVNPINKCNETSLFSQEDKGSWSQRGKFRNLEIEIGDKG